MQDKQTLGKNMYHRVHCNNIRHNKTERKTTDEKEKKFKVKFEVKSSCL